MKKSEASKDKIELVIEGVFDDVDSQYEGRAIVMSLRGPIFINGEEQVGPFQSEKLGLSVALRSWDDRYGSFGCTPPNRHKLAKLLAHRKVKLTITTADEEKPQNIDLRKLFGDVVLDFGDDEE